MKWVRLITKWLGNKFVIAFLAFTTWMLFFDRNDIFLQIERTQEKSQLEKSKSYLEGEINRTRTELEQLKSNPATLEQYARERFFMKKDNEDIFIVPDSTVAKVQSKQ